jgi:UDP-2,4-diacetamido-2,4,6-trideoxy-beta-L-altropyranose hydrolase
VENICTDAPWMLRVSSSPSAGGGHVMRCLSLAKELANYVIVFMVLDDGSQSWIDSINCKNIILSEASKENHRVWGGVVLDGYDFDEDYVLSIRGRVSFIAYMDDFLDSNLSVDLFINSAPNLYRNNIKNSPALLGSKYALVAEEYINRAPLDISINVKHILINFGKIDSKNATSLAIEGLIILRRRNFRPKISVLMGKGSRWLSYVQKITEKVNGTCYIEFPINKIADILHDSDLVIGAGGLSLLERMASGTPSLTVGLSKNQSLFINGAESKGGTNYIGMIDSLSKKNMAEYIYNLSNDYESRKKMAIHGVNIIDGLGAARMANALLNACRKCN